MATSAGETESLVNSPTLCAVRIFSTTKSSGAIPRPRKKALLERIMKLEEAVKFARERANTIEATEVSAGRRILDFIFEGTQADGPVVKNK